MTPHVSELTISESAYQALQAIVRETPEGLETGATLFGARQNGSRVALIAVGPGPKAIHRPGFHEPDIGYVNRERERLLQSFSRLEWIGSLHVHPFGMPWLSGHDRRTIRKLLDETSGLYLPDFIAGIIQRQGSNLLIYPYLASPADLEPRLIPLRIFPENADLVRDALEAAKGPAVENPTKVDAARPRRVDLRTWYARLYSRILQGSKRSSTNQEKAA